MIPNSSIHNRHSIRLPGYDYAQAGAYFVTMVTHHREMLFGEFLDGVVRLSAAGRIVNQEWQRLPRQFANVHLDMFVVMPNHIHGIIFIVVGVGATRPLPDKAIDSQRFQPDMVLDGEDGSPLRIQEDGVGATRPLPERLSDGQGFLPDMVLDGEDGSPVRARPKGPQSGSLGAIIGQFKSKATKRIWSKAGIGHPLIWQRNYYEHIIRNEGDLTRIRQYIRDNPLKWETDMENPDRMNS